MKVFMLASNLYSIYVALIDNEHKKERILLHHNCDQQFENDFQVTVFEVVKVETNWMKIHGVLHVDIKL